MAIPQNGIAIILIYFLAYTVATNPANFAALTNK